MAAHRENNAFIVYFKTYEAACRRFAGNATWAQQVEASREIDERDLIRELEALRSEGMASPRISLSRALPRPSTPFHALPRPSTPFHTLPHAFHTPSTPFHTLPQPSTPFHALR